MGNGVVIFGLWVAAILSLVSARNSIYNVADYGAVGNGQRDDTQAFLKAWGAACADSYYPTFLIPSGKGRTFLLSQITFSGPCKSNVHVQVSGNLVAPNKLWTKKPETWIVFINIEGLTVDGHGQIDGQGAIWWPCITKHICSGAPYIMQFLGCTGLKLSGIYLKNSPGKHLAIYKSDWTTIKGLTITAPGDSPNTDGILIAESNHVHVYSSNIGVGDDCVAIGSGCYDVNISSVTCGPGHGISIGSLGANSKVEKVRVSGCNIFQTTVGVRIKTWQGGSGYAKNILYEHIVFNSVRSPILIDQYYCPQGNCANKTSAVAISDVTYNDLHGTSVDPVAIKIACSESMKCDRVVLNDVSFSFEGSQAPMQSYCLNAYGKMYGKVVPEVPCLKW
ncbi:uncharacterized protein A4U43_C03F30490 [Asparagus officinalis]|uniref:Polygalacturonase n=2 Tax=Asparagus officinalis TaxID=4686 RepID=A0A5P1FE64_ASPOF|nr:uncharacterized protein A4U43_C03F30490 [Asparagus officinalis]